MGMLKNVITLVVVSLLVIVVAGFAVSALKIGKRPAPGVGGVPTVPLEGLRVLPAKAPETVSGLKSPIELAGLSQRGYPGAPLSSVAPRKAMPDPLVSLVVLREQVKMAIVGGVVVKEGDNTRIGQVKKITNDGVLITGKEGEKWLKIK
jgi:hypothetical protein